MFGFLVLLTFVCNFQPAHTDGKGFPSCVFPFVFDGKSYTSCTKDGAVDEQLWCGITANYDEDGLWKHCSIQEHGGNSGGKPCIFPFIYKNRTYYTCTKEEKGSFWCATTRNYDKDVKWSYCADTRLDANPKGPCVFPFIYNHTSYSSCTMDGISNKKPWCSLTENYDADSQWTYCEPSDSRPDPEMETSSCIFPFIYKGSLYSMCTSDGMNNGTLWCATTSNYDVDKKWMYCNVTGPDEIVESLPCIFPFIYEGRIYTNCTTDGQSSGKLWCATTSSYDVEKKWKFCEEDSEPDPVTENPFCVFPFIYKGVSYNTCTTEGMSDGKLWCANTSNYDVDKKWVYCNVTGPDVDLKSSCAFPFIYNHKIYLSCTTDGMVGKKPWCSLTTNYNADLQWIYCEPLGPGEVMEKPPCIFPFVYKGNIYSNCTPDGRRDRRPWCATTDSYDMDSKGKFCQQPGPDPKVESPSCIFPFTFKDKTYRTCTSDGMSDGKLWCATTSNYDLDKKWVYCNVTGPDPNVEGPSCIFPFIFNGASYDVCATEGLADGKFWCATSSNYDVDKKWTYCNVTGPDKDVESLPCFFPFIYKGRIYTNCTTDGQTNGKMWCATSSNYDADKKWRFCQEDSVEGVKTQQKQQIQMASLKGDSGPDPEVESTSCTFPFIYGDNSYNACTTNGMSDGKLWCATTSNYDVDKKWVYCNVTGPDTSKEAPTCVFPFIFNGKNYSSCTEDGRRDGKLWCATTTNYDRDKKWILCTVTKTGCVFPFTYKGKSYETCTMVDQNEGKAWCATTPDYQSGSNWRLCNETDCAFPFVFRDKLYSSCTRAGRNDRKRWCSLTANADADRKWLFC